jgi:hypothetical protein
VSDEVYARQAAAALAAVSVRPPGAFAWFGRRVEAGGDGLAAAIARRLEEDFYGHGAPRPPRGGPVTAADEGGSFARTLSQANNGRGSWQAGWRVERVERVDDDDEDEDAAITVVRPDGLRLRASPDDCRGVGAAVEVRLPKEVPGSSPGLYVALGDTPAPITDRVRLFWNISAAGAVTFVARATHALNRAELPFALELYDNPARYGRRAAASLLLSRPDFAGAIELLRPLLRALAGQLSDGAPAFTKPLGRGLALAEEPDGDERFGAHRCGLLAEAIVGADDRGVTAPERRLDAVRERFAAAGLRLDAPYLRPGSTDAYVS